MWTGQVVIGLDEGMFVSGFCFPGVLAQMRQTREWGRSSGLSVVLASLLATPTCITNLRSRRQRRGFNMSYLRWNRHPRVRRRCLLCFAKYWYQEPHRTDHVFLSLLPAIAMRVEIQK